MQKSARAIYRLPPIFSQAPAVENFKFPARFFKFHFKNPARFFKSRGRGRRSFFCSPSLSLPGNGSPAPPLPPGFSIFVSKFPPRYFPKSAPGFHKVVSKIRNRFFKFRFQNPRRFFKVAHSSLVQKSRKSRFQGNWANQNITHFTPNPHGRVHACHVFYPSKGVSRVTVCNTPPPMKSRNASNGACSRVFHFRRAR